MSAPTEGVPSARSLEAMNTAHDADFIRGLTKPAGRLLDTREAAAVADALVAEARAEELNRFAAINLSATNGAMLEERARCTAIVLAAIDDATEWEEVAALGSVLARIEADR